MHRFALALFASNLAGACAQGFAATPQPPVQSTREVRLEIPADARGRFTVESLVGRIRVVAGEGEAPIVVALVSGESDELVAPVTFDRVEGENGTPTFRLRFPLDEHKSYRLPRRMEGAPEWINDGRVRSQTKFAGKSVSLSTDAGVLLYADVEVQLPKRGADAAFVLAAGPVSARDVEGKLRFRCGMGDLALERVVGEVSGATGSGDIAAQGLRGKVELSTGSGNVKAASLSGSVTCKTGSGDCRLMSFQGDEAICSTGSGDVQLRAASAKRIVSKTGSGNVEMVEAEPEELEAKTGSGNVRIQTKSRRLSQADISTGSGDVALELGDDASFEARASQGSGDLRSRFKDAEPIHKGKRIVGYRRGEATARIAMSTGSGNVTIGP